MPIDLGTGVTIAFGTSAFVANVMSISHGGIQRPSVDTTHLGTTTARTFMPGDLYDGGEITLNIQWDPAAAVKPPIGGAVETITIDFGTPTVSFSGFATGYGYDVPLEELMTSEITIKVTGAITYA